MTYSAYNIIHFAGIFAMLAALAGLFAIAVDRDDRKSHPAHRLLIIMHGVGALLILVAGFGMLAKLGEPGIPGWVVVKLLLWLVLGGSVAFARKGVALWMLAAVPLLAMLAGIIAILKPF